MIAEIKVKFYSKKTGVGYNDWRQVFCEKTNTWMQTKYHAGRLVFGRERKAFNDVRNSISHKNHTVREFVPF
jgi:hypothetical protein